MKRIFVIIFAIVFVWSAINPKEYFTWFLEVVPAIIGLVILIFTFNKFKFTNLVYGLILFHSIVLMIGGHYTYAEVPFFDWLANVFDWSRNNYDKVGHFAQGFVPAMITRELLIRKKVVNFKDWRNFIIVAVCMAFSAFYELLEWLISVLTTLSTGESAEAFLGTQGYVWDTQSDMLFATIGAILAIVC